MKKMISNLFKSKKEKKSDIPVPGNIKIMSSVYPQERLSFNDLFEHVHSNLKTS